MNAKFRMLGAVVLVLALLATGALPVAAQGLTGAIYTTDVGCTGVNVNLFASKDDVYLDGGPQGGGSGLPDGYYYVQVTAPEGTLLGKTLAAVVQVSSGEFVQCYQLVNILYTASSGFTSQGFDDTPNAGGVYKVWVSTDPTFPNNLSKTDNFKVRADVTPAELNVLKFYDANANGMDDDAQYIAGWKVNIQDGVEYDRYTPVTILLDPDVYYVSEYMPIEPNWLATTPSPVTVDLPQGGSATVKFGNLCVGAGGGLTLGFWSNKNGQKLFGADDLALMVSLNLRKADGSAFDPGSYSVFRTWLLGANATNMAYMLSAQLAAMELNVFNGKVNGAALIYAPGTTSANALGFATVNDVMAEANTELGIHGTAVAGDAWRSYQEALKNALDRANNNYTFVQPTPCPFTFAEPAVGAAASDLADYTHALFLPAVRN
jgi:hypothetical protein